MLFVSGCQENDTRLKTCTVHKLHHDDKCLTFYTFHCAFLKGSSDAHFPQVDMIL